MIGKIIIVEHHLGFIKLKFSCPPPLLNRCAKLFFLFIIIANTALLLYSSIFSIVEQTVGFNNSNLTPPPDQPKTTPSLSQTQSTIKSVWL